MDGGDASQSGKGRRHIASAECLLQHTTRCTHTVCAAAATAAACKKKADASAAKRQAAEEAAKARKNKERLHAMFAKAAGACCWCACVHVLCCFGARAVGVLLVCCWRVCHVCCCCAVGAHGRRKYGRYIGPARSPGHCLTLAFVQWSSFRFCGFLWGPPQTQLALALTLRPARPTA